MSITKIPKDRCDDPGDSGMIRRYLNFDLSLYYSWQEQFPTVLSIIKMFYTLLLSLY